jgi:hypothetical protein
MSGEEAKKARGKPPGSLKENAMRATLQKDQITLRISCRGNVGRERRCETLLVDGESRVGCLLRSQKLVENWWFKILDFCHTK